MQAAIKKTSSPLLTRTVWCLLLLQVVSNLFWLRLDSLPLIWDAGSYYAISLTQLRHFEELGLIKFLFGPLFTSQYPPYHPPLLYSLPLIPYMALGPSQDVAVFCTSTLSYIAIIALTFLLARELYGTMVANIATVIVTFFSPLYGLSRTFLMDLPCLALSLLAVYTLFRSRHFRHLRWSWLFAGSFAFGLWIKEFTLIYTLLPIAVVSTKGLLDKETRVATISFVTLAALLGSIPYLFHFDERVTHYLHEQFSKPEVYNNPHGLTLSAFSYYLEAFERYQSSAMLYIFLLLFFLYVLMKPTDITGYWILSIYAVLSVIGIKTDRFLIGLLPGLAIAAAYVLNARATASRVAQACVTTLLALQFLILSYMPGIPILGLEIFQPNAELDEHPHSLKRAFIPLQLLTDGARRPLVNWSHSERVCSTIATEHGNRDKHLTVYNLSGYAYYTSRIQSCLAENGMSSWVTTPAYSELETLTKADYVITKTGPHLIAKWDEETIEKARNEFKARKNQFKSLYKIKDSDGGRTELYKAVM